MIKNLPAITVYAALLLFITTVSTPALAKDLSLDDPARFNHQFAQVNGIKVHCVDEGKTPWSFYCTDTGMSKG